MKPAPFKYLAARTEAELADLLAEHGGEARILAGGQSLVPMMNFRVVSPAVLIDINRIESMNFISANADAITVGALTRHAAFEDTPDLRSRLPIAAEAVSYLAHRAVRNRGTIGGSLALAYPNAELPLLLTTLNGAVRLRSKAGDRRLPIADFITGPLDSALREDEFVAAAELALPPQNSGMAFIEVSRRHGDFAMAAAGAVMALGGDGRINSLTAAISGGQGFPLRASLCEEQLIGQTPGSKLFADAARSMVESIDVDGDAHIPAGYRQLLLTTVLQRALDTAAQRAEAIHVG
jgi:CO/xanthine dehydrogenase FAD-binding subunit